MSESENKNHSSTSPSNRFPETFGVDPELLKILVCPMGHAELKLEEGYLICTRCGPKFKIEDGIPVMLMEDAVLPEGVSRIEDLPCAVEKARREGSSKEK